MINLLIQSTFLNNTKQRLCLLKDLTQDLMTQADDSHAALV